MAAQFSQQLAAVTNAIERGRLPPTPVQAANPPPPPSEDGGEDVLPQSPPLPRSLSKSKKAHKDKKKDRRRRRYSSPTSSSSSSSSPVSSPRSSNSSSTSDSDCDGSSESTDSRRKPRRAKGSHYATSGKGYHTREGRPSMMVPEGLHSNSRRSLRPHASTSKPSNHRSRESRRHAKRHAATPLLPRTQPCRTSRTFLSSGYDTMGATAEPTPNPLMPHLNIR